MKSERKKRIVKKTREKERKIKVADTLSENINEKRMRKKKHFYEKV